MNDYQEVIEYYQSQRQQQNDANWLESTMDIESRGSQVAQSQEVTTNGSEQLARVILCGDADQYLKRMNEEENKQQSQHTLSKLRSSISRITSAALQYILKYPINFMIKAFKLFVIASFILISEFLMVTYLLTCFSFFLLVASARGSFQLALLFIWIGLMSYYFIVYMMIKYYLTKYMHGHLTNETSNFFVAYVKKRCLDIHKQRIEGLVLSLRHLIDLHQSSQLSQVDFLLRFNLIMFQFITYERPSYMNTVLRIERRRSRVRGEDDVQLGRELVEQIMLNLRERFDQNQVERMLVIPHRQNHPFERQGLTLREVTSIKTSKFDSNIDHEESCCICLDNFKQGIEIKKLQCKHYYHKQCLDKWLIRCGQCPLCKQDIFQQNPSQVDNI